MKRRLKYGVASFANIAKRFKDPSFIFKVFDPTKFAAPSFANTDIFDIEFSKPVSKPKLMADIEVDMEPSSKKIKMDEGDETAQSQRGTIGSIPRGLLPRNTRTFTFNKLRRFRFTTSLISRSVLNSPYNADIVKYDWCIIPNNNLSWFCCAADFTHMFGPGICGFRVNKIGIRGFAPKISVVQPFNSTALVSPERPYFMIFVDERRLLFPQGANTQCNTGQQNYSPNVAIMPPERLSASTFNNNYQGFSTPVDLPNYVHAHIRPFKSSYKIVRETNVNNVTVPNHVEFLPPTATTKMSDVEMFLDIDSLGGIQLMESGQQFVYQETVSGEMMDVQDLGDLALTYPSYNLDSGDTISADDVAIPFANLTYNGKNSRFGETRSLYTKKGMPVKPILVKVMTDRVVVGGTPQIINYHVDFLAEYSIECECEYAGTTGAVDLYTMVNGVPLPNLNTSHYASQRGAMNSSKPVKQLKPTVSSNDYNQGNFM